MDEDHVTDILHALHNYVKDNPFLFWGKDYQDESYDSFVEFGLPLFDRFITKERNYN